MFLKTVLHVYVGFHDIYLKGFHIENRKDISKIASST